MALRQKQTPTAVPSKAALLSSKAAKIVEKKGTASMTARKPGQPEPFKFDLSAHKPKPLDGVLHLGALLAWTADPRPALCRWVRNQPAKPGQIVTEDVAEATCPDCKRIRADGMALYEKIKKGGK